MMKNLKETLIERGYPERAAEITSSKLANLKGQFKEALDAWIEKCSEPQLEVKDFSISGLMSRFNGMTYPAALLTLDWLNRDYDLAKAAIERGIR